MDSACQSGTPPCPPEKVCQEDSDTCDDCAEPSDCDDGLFCSGIETCVSGSCASGPNPCPGQSCDENLDQCVDCLGTDACDDGDECTENDACESGVCVGTAVDCSTEDLCVLSWSCDVALGCQNEYVECDDGDVCTNDNCDSSTGECENEPIWPYQDDCTSICDGNIEVPTVVPANNDDDNHNGIEDRLEFETTNPYVPLEIPEEDDLVPISLIPLNGAGNCEAPWVWMSGIWFNRKFHHYWNEKRTGWIDYRGHGSQAVVLPAVMWLEGYQGTDVCGVPVMLDMSGGPLCQWESEPIIIYEVESLEWQTVGGNLPLDTCPNNGGKQIFPGKIGPNDSTPNVRRQVDLVAIVEPPIPGVQVYFKVWDVDDPFDQLRACDPVNPAPDCVPNVGEIDNNRAGPDNRPVPEEPLTHTVTTEEDGTATWTITVSMQPGNNYRAAASALSDVFGPDPQVTQTTADLLGVTGAEGNFVANGGDSGYKVPVVWSKMLTVWRKLHVEVDSMMAPDFTNTQTGIIPSAPTFNATNNHAFITLAGLESVFNKTDQHKVGRIDVLSFGSFVTIATVKGPPPIVEIINAPPNIVTAAGVSYNLWDDDAGSVPPFVMVGFNAPPVTLPKVLDTSLMDNVFQMAYVDVPGPDMQYYDTTTAFDRNVAENEAADKGKENRDLTSESGYWVVHITSAFQGYTDKDGDPDIEQGGDGLQYGVTGVRLFFGAARSGSLVHLETIRDDKRGNLAAMIELERYTVTHEAGHQFLLEHVDGYQPPGDNQNPAGDFIMTNVTDQTGMAPNVAFSAVSLKKIRSSAYPPQGD